MEGWLSAGKNSIERKDALLLCGLADLAGVIGSDEEVFVLHSRVAVCLHRTRGHGAGNFSTSDDLRTSIRILQPGTGHLGKPMLPLGAEEALKLLVVAAGLAQESAGTLVSEVPRLRPERGHHIGEDLVGCVGDQTVESADGRPHLPGCSVFAELRASDLSVLEGL